MVEVDGDVHDVPDRVVARADQVADQALLAHGGQADAGLLGELEHEHRQRPRRREHAPLDRDHLRQVGVAQPADLDAPAAARARGSAIEPLAHAPRSRLERQLGVGAAQVVGQHIRVARPPAPADAPSSQIAAALTQVQRLESRGHPDAGADRAARGSAPRRRRPTKPSASGSAPASASTLEHVLGRERRAARQLGGSPAVGRRPRTPRPGARRSRPARHRCRRAVRPRARAPGERAQARDADQLGCPATAQGRARWRSRRAGPVNVPGPAPTAMRSIVASTRVPASASSSSAIASSRVACPGCAPAAGRRALRCVDPSARRRATAVDGGRGVEAEHDHRRLELLDLHRSGGRRRVAERDPQARARRAPARRPGGHSTNAIRPVPR